MLQRRDAIIRRAAGVVYRQGFSASRISEILKGAGVGRGNFYHHIKGKEALGIAIVDGLATSVGGVDMDDIFSPMKLPMRRLDDYLEIVHRTCVSAGIGDPLCVLANELGATPPFAERIRRAMHALVDRVEALCSEFAVESRAKIEARRLARAIVAQVHGLCTQFKVDRDAEALSQGLVAVPDTLLSAIGRGPRDGRAAHDGTRVRMHG